MEVKKINEIKDSPYTALLYCAPGVGKSTAIGLIAEKSEGNTLVLDVDRTIQKTLAKKEVVKDTSKVLITQIENRGKNDKLKITGTFADWSDTLEQIAKDNCKFLKDNDIRTVAVDNISELERCILSDLGAQGNNKGVPALADYQHMQFKLVNSLRDMKAWDVNIVWTAWEDVRDIVYTDGTKYSQSVPKIADKIRDNICGLCDVVGKILAKNDGTRGVVLEARKDMYAKNQIDSRKGCKVEEFINWEV